MNTQKITQEEKNNIRIQKRKEALQRAQKKYYAKNKEIIDAKNKEYIKNNADANKGRASKFYKKLKEDPEQYKILSTYHKERYQRIKKASSDSGSGSE